MTTHTIRLWRTSAVALLLISLCPYTTWAQQNTPCRQLPWEAKLVYDINTTGNGQWHDASAILSETLLPITLGTPLALIAYAHVNNNSVTSYEVSRYTSETGIQLLTTELITYGIIGASKILVDRDRPYETYPGCITGYQQPLGTSFPSGHSAGTAALATTLILRYPTWYVAAPSVAYALLTGLARMHLGVHYLTDVLAGYAIGVGTALLVHSYNSTLFTLASPIIPSMPVTSTHLGILSITIPL